MSRSNEGATKRAPYHHGDLHRGLLESARELVHESGADSISLREVARRAGVSHAAAYYHFVDKNDLLRGLAIDAFDELRIQLERAAADHGHSADLLERVAVSYLQFALKHPAEFRFMFRRDLCMPPGVPDPLEAASRLAQQVAIDAVVDGQASGHVRAGDAESISLSFWSVIHGLTTIVLETPAFKSIPPEAAEDLARQSIRDLVKGIG